MRLDRAALFLAALAAVAMMGCGKSGGIPGPGTVQDVSSSNIAAMLDRHNDTRLDEGLDTLRTDTRLSEIAQDHARYMAQRGNLSHEGPGGSRVDDRADDIGYNWVELGENIANATSGSNAYQLWLGSPGHYGNIVGDQYEEIGIGGASNGTFQYWCVVFGTEN